MRHTDEIAKLFNKSQDKIRKQQVLFHEKISQNSIAVLSLSIPFVGFLSSRSCQNAVNFAQEFLCVPLCYFLFYGWFFLALSFVLGTIFRKKSYEYCHNTAYQSMISSVNLSSDKEDVNGKKNMDKSFSVIKNLNFWNPKFFVIGIFLVLIFVFGSVVQLMKI